MIKLQAAMGLGLLLLSFTIFTLTIIFPAVWITVTLKSIQATKKNEQVLNWKIYINSIAKGFAYGLITLLIIAIIVFLFLYFFVDLTIS